MCDFNKPDNDLILSDSKVKCINYFLKFSDANGVVNLNNHNLDYVVSNIDGYVVPEHDEPFVNIDLRHDRSSSPY